MNQDHQRFVQGWQCREVEAVEALHGGEPRRLDAALDHAPLAVDQLQLGKPEQIPGMVGALGGALARNLVILAQERRQLEGLEVVRQENLRCVAHAAAPLSGCTDKLRVSRLRAIRAVQAASSPKFRA